ncbi:MutS-related protein [Rummeliibacillus sp. JY-2-4R]
MENPILFTAIIIILFFTYHLLTTKKKKLKKLRQEWDTGRFVARHEEPQSVSMYWENKRNSEEVYDGIDQMTWNDLSLQEVYNKLNYTQTSVGSEYLYNQLRDINPLQNNFQENEQLYGLFESKQGLREEILLILSGLGKQDYANSSSFFIEEQKNIKNVFIYIFLSLLPFLAVTIMFFNIYYGVMSLIGAFFLNAITYYKNKPQLESHIYSPSYLAAIISTGKRLSAVDHPDFQPIADELKDHVKPIKKVLFLSNIASIGKGNGEFDVLFEYVRIIFLLDFISYNKIVKTISKNKAEYRRLWETIGQLDAGIAVAFYRKTLGNYCNPKFCEEEELSFENMIHPLIVNPIANTSTLGKSTLITGSNASGKSTYIKAVAINAILAQTINTVLAESWTMKPSYIVTSMAISDNVFDGDSYFIAEIKSLKRITELCAQEKPFISFIDEILKGTNTIERIAASASIMQWLSSNKGMTIIASHDMELTKISRKTYTNYHFKETIENNKVHFDYKIHSGPSKTRNAIKLLDVLNYPETIVKNANGIAEHFAEQHEWVEIN